MQRRKISALTVFVGIMTTAPIAVANDIPPCESTIRPTEVRGPGVVIERCNPTGEARVSFAINVDGRTSDIVVESVQAVEGERFNSCLSEYALDAVRKVRYPVRDNACRHTIPVRFSLE